LVRGVLAASLLFLATSACTAVAGGAAALGLIAVGALTSRCYDYLDVTVLDADGHKTCAATVTASNGKSQLELTSCYYTPLTDGRWTLRASLPGLSDAVSKVEVDHAHDCIRHVQTVELTLRRPGDVPPAPKPLPSPPTIPSPAPPTPAAPPPSALPATDPLAPAPATSSNAPPTNSALPAIQTLPDQSETSH
jgi:hypothetical protein